MARNLFVGVQSDLRPIAPSLVAYLAKQLAFDQCVVRAPMGLDMSEERPLQFSDVLFKETKHLEGGIADNVTLFIGAPDLVQLDSWYIIAKVIDTWGGLGIKSLCFEAMTAWNPQFRFAYECSRIAGIRVMVEGIPTSGMPLDLEVLLQSQRYANNLRLNQLDKRYQYNVIVRRDALRYSGVFKGLFGKAPKTLDELQKLLESTGAEVFRYPELPINITKA